MYALFLETRAAEEVRQYAQINPDVDVDGLLKTTYQRALESFLSEEGDGWAPYTGPVSAEQQQKFDDWWVQLCLIDDMHKQQDVDMLFCWGETPEGGDFWEGVSRREENAGW